MSKITTLTQIKLLAVAAKNFAETLVSNTSAAIVEAIEELNSIKANITELTAHNLSDTAHSDIRASIASTSDPTYGICGTDAATAAKVGTLSGFALKTGAIIGLKFTYANTASSPTLNVNSTGAKPIYYNGAEITSGMIVANMTAEFMYNGTQWVLMNPSQSPVFGSYTGSGGSGRTFSLGFQPSVVMVIGAYTTESSQNPNFHIITDSYAIPIINGSVSGLLDQVFGTYYVGFTSRCTSDGFEIRDYNGIELELPGKLYYYIAFR